MERNSDDHLAVIGGVENHYAYARCAAGWLAMQLGGRELRVLLAISLYAEWSDGVGRAAPKRSMIAMATGLRHSHVSAAIRSLVNRGILSMLRLGRRNVYYMDVSRPQTMPKSDVANFFKRIAVLGVRLTIGSGGIMQYLPGSKTIEELPLLERAIFNDYANGMTMAALRAAVTSTFDGDDVGSSDGASSSS